MGWRPTLEGGLPGTSIEMKSELCLRLVGVKAVDNNRVVDESCTTPLMRAVEIDNVEMLDALLAASCGGTAARGASACANDPPPCITLTTCAEVALMALESTGSNLRLPSGLVVTRIAF